MSVRGEIEARSDQIKLPAPEWREMRVAAAELDLVHGGAYRVRPTSIAFYCSPENHPEGWELPYTDGAPGAPRQFVGQAELVTDDEVSDTVEVRLAVANWSALLAARQHPSSPGEEEALQAAFRGRREDQAWLRREFARLRAHASGGLVGDTQES
jgi:hypothetical protein